MKITLDKSADAAYIYIESENIVVTKTIPVEWIDGMINIDFSEDGKMVWIEVISASKLLSKDILDIASIIG